MSRLSKSIGMTGLWFKDFILGPPVLPVMLYLPYSRDQRPPGNWHWEPSKPCQETRLQRQQRQQPTLRLVTIAGPAGRERGRTITWWRIFLSLHSFHCSVRTHKPTMGRGKSVNIETGFREPAGFTSSQTECRYLCSSCGSLLSGARVRPCLTEELAAPLSHSSWCVGTRPCLWNRLRRLCTARESSCCCVAILIRSARHREMWRRGVRI